MTTGGGDQREPDRETPDSFEALLRQVAQAPAPAPVARLSTLPVGASVAGGRFSILRKLGEGGMGVVYEAFDTQRKHRVALKTLTRMEPGSVYRLKNEFRALSDVTHDNLVRLHELFSADDGWFFTMELVDGVRFDRWVRPERALDEARLRAALPQLLSAVSALHAAGKLHRDLKPSNVLVTADARVRVLDFGLVAAPELGGVGQTVADDGVAGTPAYMAPEQAAGLPAAAASDFYALGVMLFEALTGELPFAGRTAEVLVDKQRVDAPRASTRSAGIPAELDALCAELLARAAAARPGEAALRARLGMVQELPGRRPAQAGSAARAELLGRERELEALRDAHGAAVAGQAVVLFVSGESGMGKSALVSAFLDELRAEEHAVVLAGRCYERENVPFKAFDALVDELSRHLRKLPAAQAAALLPREIGALSRIFPVLDRVPVVADAPRKAMTDPQELRRAACAAFGELLARLRDRQPLVLFIDDLQWTDQDSVTFMRLLLAQREVVPALFVACHRSEGAADNPLLSAMIEAARDNPGIELRKLEVGPLPESAAAALASRMLRDGADASLALALARESGGSPFFAGELARASRGGGAEVPSLAGAVAAHVAALGEGARRVLQVLALAGQPLPAAVALDAAALPAGHDELDALRVESLVRVSSGSEGTRTVECYHDKIRESVSAALPSVLTRELSAGLARALDAYAEADKELLTRCLEAAGEPQRAAEQAVVAAQAAAAALAFERAARLYDKALSLGAFPDAQAHALRVERARAWADGGRGVFAAEAYLQARQSAERGEVAELTRLAAEQYLLCGRLSEGRALMAEALRPLQLGFPLSPAATLASLAFERSRLRLRGLGCAVRDQVAPSVVERLDALHAVTHALMRCDPVRAALFSALSTRHALDAGDVVRAARSLAWEILIAASVGVSQARLAAVTARARELCERAEDPAAWEAYLFSTGFAHLFTGDYAQAREIFGRCLQHYAEHPRLAGYNRAWAEVFHSYAGVGLGRMQEVADGAAAQLESVRARGDFTLLPMWTGGYVTVARVACGREEEAARDAERTLREWQPPEVTNQCAALAAGRFYQHAYADQPREAWADAERFEQRLRTSFMARTAVAEATVAFRTGAALLLASATKDRDERRRLLAVAGRLVPSIEGSRLAIVGTVPVRAGLAMQRGQVELAVQALREFSSAPHVPPMFAFAAKRRLGMLLGGDAGGALVAEADAFLRAGGAVDPERLANALTPGCEPS